MAQADEDDSPFEQPEEKALVETEDRLARYRPRIKTEVETETDASRAADHDTEIAKGV